MILVPNYCFVLFSVINWDSSMGIEKRVPITFPADKTICAFFDGGEPVLSIVWLLHSISNTSIKISRIIVFRHPLWGSFISAHTITQPNFGKCYPFQIEAIYYCIQYNFLSCYKSTPYILFGLLSKQTNWQIALYCLISLILKTKTNLVSDYYPLRRLF